MLLSGWPNRTPYRLRLPADFSRWEDAAGWNILLLVLVGLGLLSIGFAAAGFARSRRPGGVPARQE